MERTMTVEEKIKRAEEIYARRHGEDVKSTATLRVNGKEKKDIKLFKKLILQMVACLLIYLVFYTVQHSDFIFSEDFVSKTNELLSYDTNFGEIYNNIVNGIQGFLHKQKEQNMGGASEDNKNESGDNTKTDEKDNKEGENKTEEKNDKDVEQNKTNENNKEEINAVAPNNANSQNVEMTEEEKVIAEIKNTTTFIKPVEGVISSKYGHREPTTSTVPKEHTGTDIAADLGTKIKSSTDGEVVVASSEGDYRKAFKNKNRKCKYYLCSL